jgi:hypothetical protein
MKGAIMITHLADSRGHADHGWLKSHHTFSFADYYDQNRMHFGALRVINDDFIAPDMGFGTHPHRDMEIITIPLSGALSHKDSMGHAREIKKGEVQAMSAGTGLYHSEYNASKTEAVTLLQIWVMPKKLGIKPRYDQKEFEFQKGQGTLVISPDGRDGSLEVNQDTFFTIANLKDESFHYDRKMNGNGVYIFVISGEIEIDGKSFSARDGIGITEFDQLKFAVKGESEVLLMEVPMLGEK